MQKTLANINLVIAFVATTAPFAHVLELFSKLRLDGPTWLAVQQQLYRGWGPVFGPVEIAALATSAWLFAIARTERTSYLLASACYALMLACFFLFNAPVNEAFAGWTTASLPSNWPNYRLKWETGHALAALFSAIGFAALVRARIRMEAAPSVPVE